MTPQNLPGWIEELKQIVEVTDTLNPEECRQVIEALSIVIGTLEASWLSDRTPEYEYGQENRTGMKPGMGQRWKTPKE